MKMKYIFIQMYLFRCGTCMCNTNCMFSLSLHVALFRLTEKALTETKASLEKVRADMQAWKTQYDSTHRKLKAEQAAYSSLKVCVLILPPGSCRMYMYNVVSVFYMYMYLGINCKITSEPQEGHPPPESFLTSLEHFSL